MEQATETYAKTTSLSLFTANWLMYSHYNVYWRLGHFLTDQSTVMHTAYTKECIRWSCNFVQLGLYWIFNIVFKKHTVTI